MSFWFGSNTKDRQNLLNLIGKFVTENPLEFHLRKDGRIGRIRVHDKTIGARFMLKKTMWKGSPGKFVVYPHLIGKATQLRKQLSTIQEALYTFQSKHCETVRDLLFNPILKVKGVRKKIDRLKSQLLELTRTEHCDWSLDLYSFRRTNRDGVNWQKIIGWKHFRGRHIPVFEYLR